MIDEEKKTSNIYVDSKTGNIIIAKKGENDSYTFYATTVEENDDIHNIDIEGLAPISDIFDYIDEHDIDVNILSKKMPNFGEKRHGK